MKFSEFPYKRPDYEKVMSEITALTEKFKAATEREGTAFYHERTRTDRD